MPLKNLPTALLATLPIIVSTCFGCIPFTVGKLNLVLVVFLIFLPWVSSPLAPLLAMFNVEELNLPLETSLPKSCIKFTTSFPELKVLLTSADLNILLKLFPNLDKKPGLIITSLVAIASASNVIVSSNASASVISLLGSAAAFWYCFILAANLVSFIVSGFNVPM